MKTVSGRVSFPIILGMLFFLIGQPAWALSYSGIGGRPAYPDPAIENSQSWFIYNLDPGSAKEDAVIIQNNTEESQDILVYPADSVPSSDGGFGLGQYVDERKFVGSWIRLYPNEAPTTTDNILRRLRGLELEDEIATSTISIRETCSILTATSSDSGERTVIEDIDNLFEDQTEIEEARHYIDHVEEWCQGLSEATITLGALENRTIPFIIAIPQDIDVGEHTGGILVQKVIFAEDDSGGGGISLTTRVGIRVYETVPGEVIAGLTITDFYYAYIREKQVYSFGVSLKNTGNASQEAEVKLTISGWPADKNFEVSRTIHALRDDTLVSNFEWPKPKFGRYTAQVEVVFDDAAGLSQTLRSETIIIWIIPWLEISIVAGILLLLFISLGIRKTARRRLVRRQQWKSYIVKRGDTLIGLARKAGVSWKRIASVNKIRRPYTLERGDRILLPAMGKEPVTAVVKRQRKTKANVKKSSKKDKSRAIRK